MGKWQTVGTATDSRGNSYTVFANIDGIDPVIYQVTKGETPTNDAGYKNLYALLKLKGLTF